MNPQFTRPENPVPFADRDGLKAFLEQHSIPHRAWSGPAFEKLWKEIVEGDTLITVESIPALGMPKVIRNIRTITLRITHDIEECAKQNRMVLNEFIVHGSDMQPRKYTASSVSEKLLWNAPGGEEKPFSGIVRVLKEELDIDVCHDDLTNENLYRVRPEDRINMMRFVHNDERSSQGITEIYFKREFDEFLERGIELDVRFSKRFPGLVVRNQLAHYFWEMPSRYFNPEGYRDEKTRYVSRWIAPSGVTA